MVLLSRIYTKGGDRGQTSLGDGARVPKHHARVAAYGTVDEANAAIGLARLHTSAAAFLHQARTVTRRAERLTVELAEAEAINSAAIRYLNRLSDHLFVLSRALNDRGAADVLWVPGANR